MQSSHLLIHALQTAGLVLANRLSENSSVTVVVLEAGKAHFEDPLVDKIDGWLQQMMKPDYDWEFFTVPQPHAHDKPARWSRGKGLGGSSAINLLGWTKPEPADIDAWEKLGNPGWNFKRLHEYIKKAERDVNNTIGTDGECHCFMDHRSTLIASRPNLSCLCADEHWCRSIVPEGNAYEVGPQTNGAYKILSSIDPEKGTRASSVTGYLLPAIHRPNLKVLTEAYVNKFVTRHEGDKLTATGVEFEHGGNVYQVHATKEVILSAGAIKSPNILELSGIGDRRVLEPLGIPVLKDIPGVGANVQEHYTLTGLVLGESGERSVQNRWADGTKEMRQAPDAALSRPAHTSTATTKPEEATEAATYPPGLKEQYDIQLDILRDSQIPDLEIMLLPVSFAAPCKGLRTYELCSVCSHSTIVIGKPYISLPIVISHPFARGTIHISSADPKAAPLIDPRYFEEETERDILLEGFKFARKISNTSPFKDLVVAEVLPGPEVTEDRQIVVFNHVITFIDSAGSLSMMPQDKGGAVDPALRIYGCKNVRVVDLSVVPLTVSAHTQGMNAILITSVNTHLHPAVIVYGLAEMGLFLSPDFEIGNLCAGL
ncbi:hypothetical GMC oxidoreductase [Postia placenta Mad-698-R]|nr:hypothetical GMC oxidoreductase [Postia placenta Mad-698-R]